MAGDTMGPDRILKTADQAQRLIDEYFNDCDKVEFAKDNDGNIQMYKGQPIPIKGPKPYTVTGLCLALGFNSRNTLMEYLNRGNKAEATEIEKKISDILTRAKLKIEDYAASRLFDKDGCNGAKFTLASNFQGWSEKHDINIGDKVIKVTLEDE